MTQKNAKTNELLDTIREFFESDKMEIESNEDGLGIVLLAGTKDGEAVGGYNGRKFTCAALLTSALAGFPKELIVSSLASLRNVVGSETFDLAVTLSEADKLKREMKRENASVPS